MIGYLLQCYNMRRNIPQSIVIYLCSCSCINQAYIGRWQMLPYFSDNALNTLCMPAVYCKFNKNQIRMLTYQLLINPENTQVCICTWDGGNHFLKFSTGKPVFQKLQRLL